MCQFEGLLRDIFWRPKKKTFFLNILSPNLHLKSRNSIQTSLKLNLKIQNCIQLSLKKSSKIGNSSCVRGQIFLDFHENFEGHLDSISKSQKSMRDKTFRFEIPDSSVVGKVLFDQTHLHFLGGSRIMYFFHANEGH